MKKSLNVKHGILLVMVMLIASSLLYSCKKDGDNFSPKIVFNDSTLSIPNAGGSQRLVFVTNKSWEATTEDSWIDITKAQGNKGKDTVLFKVGANTGDKRTGHIAITIGNGSQNRVIEIVQESGISNNFYVKEGKSGEGHSWAEATNLQAALEGAVGGDTIFIAAGTYIPSETITNGDANQEGDKTFEVIKNIAIIGGYPANASQGASYDPKNNETILSGDLGNGDAAYHVVVVRAPVIADQKVVLKGLTITGGELGDNTSRFQIDGMTFSRGNGGGLNIAGSEIELTEVNVVENGAGSGTKSVAPGIFVGRGAKATFTRCKINDNVGVGNGGALYVDRSTAYVYDSEVKRNEIPGTSPAIEAYPDATLYLYNTVVAENKGGSYAASVYLRGKSKGVLVNCLITGNESSSTHGGGGLMMYDNCDATVISTTITDNTIAGPGGGVFREKGNNTIAVYNSIISGNTQESGSFDIDVKGTQDDPVLKAMISGSDEYDATGSKNDNVFTSSMLDASFIPVGTNNPALSDGMGATALSGIGGSLYPPLNDDYLKVDYNHKSRAGESVMGAILP